MNDKHQPTGLPIERLNVIPTVITTYIDRIQATGLGTFEMFLDFAAVSAEKSNLEGANLAGSKFRFASFREAKMRGVDFSKADLHVARFWQAHLKKANFSEAFLQFAHFEGADLEDANFQNADLRKAWFPDADLTGANLDGALLEKAMYSKNTKWPEGFDPVAAGAILEEFDENYNIVS
ncbi:MAG: pentapeptide repeat-containing protein [Chloroflexota bacterium]